MASRGGAVDKNTEITLTVELASGYEVDEYECVAGGVTVDPATKKFTMPDEDVAIYLKTKKNNIYKVLESVEVNINGTVTKLSKNVKVLEKNGEVYGVECTPTAITFDAAVVAQLVADGIIVKV